MFRTIQLLAFTLGLSLATAGEAKTIRATEMNPSMWSKLSTAAAGDLIVEFRQGDVLPVTLAAQGDLIETTQSATSYVTVKRAFWLKVVGSSPEMSFDGTNYAPIGQAVTGSLEANAGSGTSGVPANGINIIFSAYLK